MPRMRALMGDALMPMLPRRKAAFAGIRVKSGRRHAFAERRILRAMMAGAPASAIPAGLENYRFGQGLGDMWKIAKDVISGKITIDEAMRRAGIPTGGGLPIDPRSGIAGLPGPLVAEAMAEDDRPKRRSMNPTNVRALRRSLRRVDAFKNLVKRVDKIMPAGAKVSGSAKRGHGRGCKCPTCK